MFKIMKPTFLLALALFFVSSTSFGQQPCPHSPTCGQGSKSYTHTFTCPATPVVNASDFPATTWSQPRAGLNSNLTNQFFLCTFQLDQAPCLTITWAKVTVVLCANDPSTVGGRNQSNSVNDGISYNVKAPGSTQANWKPFPPPNPQGYVYPDGPVPACPSSVTRTFVLSQADLDCLNASRKLNITEQDDSKVLSATLEVRGCCPPPVIDCHCPRGWLSNTTNVDGGPTSDGKCKKQVCVWDRALGFPPDATQIGNWGFTWGNGLYVWGSATNGGKAICEEKKCDACK